MHHIRHLSLLADQKQCVQLGGLHKATTSIERVFVVLWFRVFLVGLGFCHWIGFLCVCSLLVGLGFLRFLIKACWKYIATKVSINFDYVFI